MVSVGPLMDRHGEAVKVQGLMGPWAMALLGSQSCYWVRGVGAGGWMRRGAYYVARHAIVLAMRVDFMFFICGVRC